MMFPPDVERFTSIDAIEYMPAPVHVYRVVSWLAVGTYPISVLSVPVVAVMMDVCPLALGFALMSANAIKLKIHESVFVLVVVRVLVADTKALS